MADAHTDWPSEDEDFDAKINQGGQQKTAPRRVKVVDQAAETPALNTEASEPTPSETTNALAAADEAKPDKAAEVAPSQRAQQFSEQQATAPSDAQDEQSSVGATEAPANHQSLPAASQLAPASRRMRMPRNLSALLRLAVEVVLLIAAVGLGLWSWTLYNDRKDLQTQVDNLNANPQVAVQKQDQNLITSVSKLINLPSAETPTIAQVTDAAQAKQQSAFFNNAQNGDKVLMYVKTGEAILYRPSTHKIILVAPLTLSGNSTSSAKTSTSSTTSTSASTNHASTSK